MPLKLTNNATSKLAGALTASSTSLAVSPGDGAKFPALTAGDWFPLTLVKPDGSLEIVRCTARSSDTFTITRAQEGTAALAFSAGDRVELRATKAAFEEMNTNAREWTASEVTQAEAEAGTATTARKWTSQRVRQAIVAGYNALTSAFGRTLANSASEEAARATLGLGSASVLYVTTSNTDMTAGRVLKVGDGGWLGQVPISGTNIDDRTQRGWMYVGGATSGTKPSNNGIVLTYGITNDQVIQEFVESVGGPDVGIRRRFIRNCYASNNWSPWCELYHSGNLQLPLGQGQTWQDVTASRSVGTTYTNSTGRPIAIFINFTDVGTTGNMIIDGLNFGLLDNGSTSRQQIGGIVIPASSTYSITGVATVNKWMELR